MDYSSYDMSQYARGMDSYSGYSDSLSSASAAGLGAIFGAMFGVYLIFAIVIAVLQIIAMKQVGNQLFQFIMQ